MGRLGTCIVELSLSFPIRHHRPGPLSSLNVCLQHSLQSYLCFGSVHSRCISRHPRSALVAILVRLGKPHFRVRSTLWVDAVTTLSPISIFFVILSFSASCFLCDFARAGAKRSTLAAIGIDNIAHYCRPFDKYSY